MGHPFTVGWDLSRADLHFASANHLCRIINLFVAGCDCESWIDACSSLMHSLGTARIFVQVDPINSSGLFGFVCWIFWCGSVGWEYFRIPFVFALVSLYVFFLSTRPNGVFVWMWGDVWNNYPRSVLRMSSVTNGYSSVIRGWFSFQGWYVGVWWIFSVCVIRSLLCFFVRQGHVSFFTGGIWAVVGRVYVALRYCSSGLFIIWLHWAFLYTVASGKGTYYAFL